MRHRLPFGLFLLATVLASAPARAEESTTSPIALTPLTIQLPSAVLPHPVPFQSERSDDHDTLWNGVLIGAGVGAAAGMLIAPQAFCGSHDTECATIVRVAIGLPAIAGGIGIGALVDGLMSRRSSAVSGVQVHWKF